MQPTAFLLHVFMGHERSCAGDDVILRLVTAQLCHVLAQGTGR